MDLSFLTGQSQPSPGTLQWSNNANGQNMGFNSPAMAYQPGSALGLTSDSQPMTAMSGTGLTSQLGMNIPTFQLGLGALGSLGNIYGAFQANSLARDQLNFAKQTTNTNLNNQIKSYNTALEDRARSRAAAEGTGQAYADDYVARNKLSR